MPLALAPPSRRVPVSRSLLNRAAVAALALLAACHGAARPAAGPSPGAPSPVELRQAWQAAFNRTDTAALLVLYAPDAVLVPPSGTVLTGGRTAASATVGRLMEGRTLQLRAGHQRTTNAAGHLQGTWQARARDGGRLLGSGTYFMVFERGADGRWSIVYHVWRDDREPGVSRDDPAVRA